MARGLYTLKEVYRHKSMVIGEKEMDSGEVDKLAISCVYISKPYTGNILKVQVVVICKPMDGFALGCIALIVVQGVGSATKCYGVCTCSSPYFCGRFTCNSVHPRTAIHNASNERGV